MPYPDWIYYPPRQQPPEWATAIVSMIADSEHTISTLAERDKYPDSDGVLKAVAPALLRAGYEVEQSKLDKDRIKRPVLFGEHGRSVMAYSVDAVHLEMGILVEIEAGRATMGNAIYRDLIESSLIFDARFLILMVPQKYRYSGGTTAQSYRDTKNLLGAIYASQRLQLPLEGILLIGY